MKCDWCGRNINGNYVSGGFFGPYYCSNKCKHDAEASKRKNDDYYDDDDDSQSLGFFGKVWRAIKTIAIALVVLTIIGYILDKDDDKKSDDNKKTVQTPTQTAKKQSTTTTKTTSSSSKTTAGSKPVSNKSATQSTANNSKTTSNQKSTTSNPSSPNSSSVAPKNAAATTTNASAKSTTSEVDLSGEIYKALTDILESKGKSLKLNEAEGSNRGYESNIIVQMNQLRGTKYYNNALKEIMRCCPKYASEYSKNGKYFASEAEFYQSYISTDYSKKLKAKKKENR